MYKVLIVDDEPFILNGLPGLIDWAEHNLEIVGLAANGQEALRIIRGTVVHIVISDIRMPRMDGLELLRTVRGGGQNIKFIMLSGYNDFEYVREAAKLGIENYLLKPVNESELALSLLETRSKIESELSRSIGIREGMEVLRDNVLYSWVSGMIGGSELKERSELLGIDMEGKGYTVAILGILSVPPAFESDRGRLLFAIRNICQETLGQGANALTFVNPDGELIMLFAEARAAHGRQRMETLLQQCIEHINKLLRADVFISTGRHVPDYREVHASFQQAKKLQGYSIVLGHNRVVSYEGFVDAAPSIRIDLQGYLADISSALKNGSRLAFANTVEQLFAELDSLNGLTPAFIRNTVLEILFSIVGVIRANYARTLPFFPEQSDMVAAVHKLSTREELKRWLLSVAGGIMEKISEQRGRLSPLILKTIDYVLLSFAEGINLKTIAAEFDVNPYYLGQLFKKETGKSFTDYLNTVRIDKAKELLLDGSLKPGDIAIKVGYFNTNYFFTVFKKITGLSPSDFAASRNF